MRSFRGITLLLLVACGSTGDSDPLDDWSPGYPGDSDADTDSDSDSDTDPVGGLISVSVNLPYAARFHGEASSDAPCELDTTGAFAEARCRLDVNELDLAFHGWNYSVSVPANTCDYLAVRNYRYERWQVGQGPVLVEYKADAEGNWLSDTANSYGGEPVCSFDYSSIDGAPNCCLGEYQIQVTEVDAGGGETQLPISPPAEWGGKAGECYSGAGYVSSITALSESGFPRTIIVDIDESSDTSYAVSFSGAINNDRGTNVLLANYFDAADGVPAALTGTYTLQDYSVSCLDQAQEVRAVVYMDVRDWDEEAEFDIEGDPNSGIATGPANDGAPIEDNGTGSYINDWWDWADFAKYPIDYPAGSE